MSTDTATSKPPSEAGLREGMLRVRIGAEEDRRRIIQAAVKKVLPGLRTIHDELRGKVGSGALSDTLGEIIGDLDAAADERYLDGLDRIFPVDDEATEAERLDAAEFALVRGRIDEKFEAVERSEEKGTGTDVERRQMLDEANGDTLTLQHKALLAIAAGHSNPRLVAQAVLGSRRVEV